MVTKFEDQGNEPAQDPLIVGGDVVSRRVTLLAGNLTRGAVLGIKEAASDEDTSADCLLSASGASDGTQTPKCILAEDCDASDDPQETVAYFSGHFNEEQLNFGVGHTKFSCRTAFDLGSNIVLVPAIT